MRKLKQFFLRIKANLIEIKDFVFMFALVTAAGMAAKSYNRYLRNIEQQDTDKMGDTSKQTILSQLKKSFILILIILFAYYFFNYQHLNKIENKLNKMDSLQTVIIKDKTWIQTLK